MENKKQTLIFKLLKENKINEEEASLLLEKDKEYVYLPNTPLPYVTSPTTAPINPWYYIGSASTSSSSSVKTSGCCGSDCNCGCNS